jgi:hypothetical protein
MNVLDKLDAGTTAFRFPLHLIYMAQSMYLVNFISFWFCEYPGSLCNTICCSVDLPIADVTILAWCLSSELAVAWFQFLWSHSYFLTSEILYKIYILIRISNVKLNTKLVHAELCCNLWRLGGWVGIVSCQGHRNGAREVVGHYLPPSPHPV